MKRKPAMVDGLVVPVSFTRTVLFLAERACSMHQPGMQREDELISMIRTHAPVLVALLLEDLEKTAKK